MAQAFSVRGRAGGSAASINVYLASRNQARKLMVALYSATGCHPGSRLTTGSLARPKAGAWNAVAVQPASIQAGRMYWLIVLGSRGVLRFRERGTNGCTSATSPLRGLTSPPASWKAGVLSNGCGSSAYAVGATATIQRGTPGTSAPTGSGAPSSTAGSPNSSSGGTNGGTGSAPPGGVSTNPLAPTAAFTVSPNPTIGQPVTFDGSGSTCAAGPCTYKWDDDGGEPPTGNWPLGSGQIIQYTFTGSAFTAYVRLTVTDALNQTATVEHNVYVAAPPSHPANSAPPTISGTAQVGAVLTASPGTWSNGLTYAYQWSYCPFERGSCASIAGGPRARIRWRVVM
jgi:hypothetical protein